MALPHREHWTEAEYLAFEQDSDLKHEYVDGKVFAMTGASWNHNLICVNTSTTLNVQLAEKDCRVTSGDLRLKLTSKPSYRYPDVMVVCGEPQFMTNLVDTILNPIVVIEVLSEATALMIVTKNWTSTFNWTLCRNTYLYPNKRQKYCASHLAIGCIHRPAAYKAVLVSPRLAASWICPMSITR